MNLVIHIDRLVLEGLPLDRTASAELERAVVEELQTLFLSQAPSHLESVARLRLADLQLPAAVAPGALGRQIAGSLHAGLAPAAAGGGEP